LNPSKCEVISHPDLKIADQTILSFICVSVADATLLGAPLFFGKVLDDTWSARFEDLKLAMERLSLLNAQDALLLLRVSFSPLGSNTSCGVRRQWTIPRWICLMDI